VAVVPVIVPIAAMVFPAVVDLGSIDIEIRVSKNVSIVELIVQMILPI
jgi:hypothetical protein